LLGKRDRPSYEIESENIVAKVETIEAPDVIEFERRPDGLPKSIKQRYEDPRTSTKREKKADSKITEKPERAENETIVADNKWG
jgi:hypothetical protein